MSVGVTDRSVPLTETSAFPCRVAAPLIVMAPPWSANGFVMAVVRSKTFAWPTRPSDSVSSVVVMRGRVVPTTVTGIFISWGSVFPSCTRTTTSPAAPSGASEVAEIRISCPETSTFSVPGAEISE